MCRVIRLRPASECCGTGVEVQKRKRGLEPGRSDALTDITSKITPEEVHRESYHPPRRRPSNKGTVLGARVRGYHHSRDELLRFTTPRSGTTRPQVCRSKFPAPRLKLR